jgi:4a-hydroxytetrahydrobiopterin dehydratase
MNWIIKNDKLTLEIDFKSQTELANFLVQVAENADKLKHHPDIFVTKAFHLKLELFTHSENKITDLDYELAKFIDRIENGNIK